MRGTLLGPCQFACQADVCGGDKVEKKKVSEPDSMLLAVLPDTVTLRVCASAVHGSGLSLSPSVPFRILVALGPRPTKKHTANAHKCTLTLTPANTIGPHALRPSPQSRHPTPGQASRPKQECEKKRKRRRARLQERQAGWSGAFAWLGLSLSRSYALQLAGANESELDVGDGIPTPQWELGN